jgi:hypothetical protein
VNQKPLANPTVTPIEGGYVQVTVPMNGHTAEVECASKMAVLVTAQTGEGDAKFDAFGHFGTW